MSRPTMRPTPTSPHSRPAPWLFRRVVLVLLAIALVATLARAIQTQEVELGNGGAYDGAVKITRDSQGRLIFGDSQVTPAVTLNDLRYAGRDHGLLLGLGDDDHPQYQNSARHGAAHTAGYNAALATPADVHGNATLGTHLLDGDIHLNRKSAVSIEGIWSFLGLPRFTAGLELAGGTLTVGGATFLDAARVAYPASMVVGTSGANTNITLLSSSSGNTARIRTTGNYVSYTGAGTGVITELASDGAIEISSNATITSYLKGAWKLHDGGSAGYPVRFSIDNATGDINNSGGAYKTGGTTRLAADGSAVLTQADIDNLRLDGNTLAATNSGGDINLAPGGAGKVAVAGDLAVGSGGARLTLNGQRFLNEINLLDNPDFTVWQRNLSQSCAAGGNAAGTITWPVPGTLATGADRWQVSRSRNDMASTVSRATPPGALPTALYCLKNELTAGTTGNQYLHQTLPRELTAGLRGKWVTFAVSHYLTGTSGGTIGIYKVVGGTPTALATYAFSSAANTWERLALAAQVPADSEVLLVSVCSNLAAGGPTAAYLANATLVEGKYVASGEKVSDPALSSVPPLTRPPAENLAACQRYFEKGALAFTSYAGDTTMLYHYTMVHYNAAKASSPMIALSNTNYAGLLPPLVSTEDTPAYSAGQSWPQGFRFQLGGMATESMSLILYADWTATCPEPI